MGHLVPRASFVRLRSRTSSRAESPAVWACLLACLLLAPSHARAALIVNVTSEVLTVQGDAASDTITLRLASGDPTRLEVIAGGVVVSSVLRDTFTAIVVDAGPGDDVVTLDATRGTFTDVETTFVQGGAGSDILIGQDGPEVFDGGPGNDTLFGGGGDDRFAWDPGDGSDVIEGQAGLDTLAFNGSDGAEIVTVTANGQRVLLFRNVGNIVMDLGAVERIQVSALGGADYFTVNPGLASMAISYDGGGGDDTITGGDGAELLMGGAGADTIDGGGGNDVLLGGPDNDTVFGGAGDDLIQWNDGDGTDVIEAGPGTDTVEVNGSDTAGDTFTIAPNGARVRLDRLAPTALFLDIGSTEQVRAH